MARVIDSLSSHCNVFTSLYYKSNKICHFLGKMVRSKKIFFSGVEGNQDNKLLLIHLHFNVILFSSTDQIILAKLYPPLSSFFIQRNDELTLFQYETYVNQDPFCHK